MPIEIQRGMTLLTRAKKVKQTLTYLNFHTPKGQHNKAKEKKENITA
jgi:hypothetical protein